MASTQDALLAAGIASYTALLGAVGGMWRSMATTLRDFRTWMVQSRAEHLQYDRDIGELRQQLGSLDAGADAMRERASQASAEHERYSQELHTLRRDVDELRRSDQAHREAIAVLGNEMEGHQRWHERGAHRAPRPGT